MNHITVNEHGLVVLEGCTTEELIQVGRELCQKHRNACWQLGDWYNSIDTGKNAKKICEEAGLNPNTIRVLGAVASAFPEDVESTQHLRKQLGYARCDAIARLPEEDRPALIKESLDNQLTMRQVRKRVSEIKGIVPRAVAQKISGDIRTALRGLVPSRFHSKLDDALQSSVRDIRKEVEDRTKLERERLNALIASNKAEQKRLRDARVSMRATLSDQDYRLILQCLHPDKAPEGMGDRFKSAFTVFKKAADIAGMRAAPRE